MRDIVEVVLPVIADARRNGEIRLQAYGVFKNSGDGPLQESDVPIPALHKIGKRIGCVVISKTRERISALVIREVIVASTADVRHVDSELDHLLACGIRDDVCSIEVILRPPIVRLRATARESTLHVHLRVFVEAVGLIVEVAD